MDTERMELLFLRRSALSEELSGAKFTLIRIPSSEETAGKKEG